MHSHISRMLEKLKELYGISNKDYNELVDLLSVDLEPERFADESFVGDSSIPSGKITVLTQGKQVTARKQLEKSRSRQGDSEPEPLKSGTSIRLNGVFEIKIINGVQCLVPVEKQHPLLSIPNAWRKSLQPAETPSRLETQSQSEEQPVPRSLDKLDEKAIQCLTVKDFAKAASRTSVPRKLMVGLNVVNQIEEEFQQRIKQYIKDNHGIEPKGKVRLNVVIHEYDSVKKGMTYKGYVRAAFDDNRSVTLYSLTEEELDAKLKRRQMEQSANSSIAFAR